MDQTPASLLERLCVGGADADWGLFVRLFTPVIYHIARRAGLQEADARDLVQDVLLQVARSLPTFRYDPSRSFRNWLKTVTWNKLRENARRTQIRALPLDESVQTRCCEASPLEALEDREIQQVVARRALELMRAEFTATTWQACWEHVVSGRSAAEIAAELKISEGAVYTAKHRVLRRLRQELMGLLD